MRTDLLILAALLVVAPATATQAAPALDRPTAALPARAPAVEDGLAFAVGEGPFFVTPGESGEIPLTLVYRDALDPLALGLLSLDVYVEPSTSPGLGATVAPSSTTLKSDGAAATLALTVFPDVDVPAWTPLPITIRAWGMDSPGRVREAEAATEVVPRQVCALVVDGALPVREAPPKRGTWTLAGTVYLVNQGNGPVRVAVRDLGAPDGSTVEPMGATEVVVAALSEAEVAYAVTVPVDVDPGAWTWRVAADALATTRPPDGSDPVRCGGSDAVRLGDERTVPPAGRNVPGAGALALVASVAAAAVLAGRRR